MPDRTVIEELERLLGEATAGEWRVCVQRHSQAEPDPESAAGHGSSIWSHVGDQTDYPVIALSQVSPRDSGDRWPWMVRLTEDDAYLIAAMKNAIPALLECARAAGDWLNADESEDSEAYAAARERARQALAALEGVGR